MKPNTSTQHINNPIDQTEWMIQESAYESVDDLHRSNPDLFDSLAAEWRNDNPWDGLGS